MKHILLVFSFFLLTACVEEEVNTGIDSNKRIAQPEEGITFPNIPENSSWVYTGHDCVGNAKLDSIQLNYQHFTHVAFGGGYMFIYGTMIHNGREVIVPEDKGPLEGDYFQNIVDLYFSEDQMTLVLGTERSHCEIRYQPMEGSLL